MGPERATAELEAICAYVAQRTGTALSRQQRERLTRAAAAHLEGRRGVPLLEHLQSPRGAHELAELMSVISVHKTDLFRDEQQLEALRAHVLAPLATAAAGGRRGRLSVWSAGCATGEEVATLLMLLAEVGAPAESRVLGTDIATRALDAARPLTFGREVMKRVPTELVRRYFVDEGAAWSLVPTLSRNARFAVHNLMDVPYPLPDGGGGFDVIVCRNVLIYFTPEAADLVVGRLAERLAPGGTLVLSAAEPILKPRTDLEPRRFGNVFFYGRLDAPRPAPVPPPPRPPPPRYPWPSAPRPSAPAYASAPTPAPSSPTPLPSSPTPAPYRSSPTPFPYRSSPTPFPSAPAPFPSAPTPLPSVPPPFPSSPTPLPSVPPFGSALTPAPSSSATPLPGPRPSAGLMRTASGELPAVRLPPEEEGRQLFELVLQWAAAGESDAETEAGLRKALYLAPEIAAARYMLGLLLERRDALADAASEYRRALAVLESGRARPTPFFLNVERLKQACRVALQRLGF